MTNNDEELVKKSEKLTSIDWSYAYVYSKQADSQETKEYLIQLGKELYRKEEYFAGLL